MDFAGEGGEMTEKRSEAIGKKVRTDVPTRENLGQTASLAFAMEKEKR